MGRHLMPTSSEDSASGGDNHYSTAKTLQRQQTVKSQGQKTGLGSTTLALYGNDDYYHSEPLLQKRIVVMVCLYLGPLACGFSSSLISIKQRGFRSPDGSPDWTDHLILLGGLVGSVIFLPLSLRFLGRIKTAAAISFILFFATVMTMVSDNEGSTGWMSRLAEFLIGLSLGLYMPTQPLIIAETAKPSQRATLAALNYVILAAGSLFAHLLSHLVPWVSGLCVMNFVILSIHFVALGFFHPDTPRYLFAVRDKKAQCANSLQWLRGKMADIGEEYTELADSITLFGPPERITTLSILQERAVLQPLITAITLMTLTALSGLLNITFLLRSNLRLGQAEQMSTHNSGSYHVMEMGYVVAGVYVAAPLIMCSLVHKIGQKMFMLVSAGLMTASLLFLTLLSHFQGNNLLQFMANSPGFGWTVQTAVVVFLTGHHIGVGPLSWIMMVEIMPIKSLEIGLSLASSVWWAFSLVFSMTLEPIVSAIGMTGLFAIHAVVCGLMYVFVLQIIPDIRANSLTEIEDFYRAITTEANLLDGKFRFSFRSNASSATNF